MGRARKGIFLLGAVGGGAALREERAGKRACVCVCARARWGKVRAPCHVRDRLGSGHGGRVEGDLPGGAAS